MAAKKKTDDENETDTPVDHVVEQHNEVDPADPPAPDHVTETSN